MCDVRTARNFSNQLSGQIGEALLVAELGRMGIVATAFAGNVPDIDILAYKDGKSTAIQVKAWKTGSVSFDARRFLDIEFDGDRQRVKGIHPNLERLPIYVFVRLGEKKTQDEFYVVDQLTLAGIVNEGYLAFLDLHGGIRPRNPKTTHNSVTVSQLGPFQDNWDALLTELSGSAET
jgi:hypothetical protein